MVSCVSANDEIYLSFLCILLQCFNQDYTEGYFFYTFWTWQKVYLERHHYTPSGMGEESTLMGIILTPTGWGWGVSKLKVDNLYFPRTRGVHAEWHNLYPLWAKEVYTEEHTLYLPGESNMKDIIYTPSRLGESILKDTYLYSPWG